MRNAGDKIPIAKRNLPARTSFILIAPVELPGSLLAVHVLKSKECPC